MRSSDKLPPNRVHRLRLVRSWDPTDLAGALITIAERSRTPARESFEKCSLFLSEKIPPFDEIVSSKKFSPLTRSSSTMYLSFLHHHQSVSGEFPLISVCRLRQQRTDATDATDDDGHLLIFTCLSLSLSLSLSCVLLRKLEVLFFPGRGRWTAAPAARMMEPCQQPPPPLHHVNYGALKLQLSGNGTTLT